MADRDSEQREPWDDTAQQYGVRRQTADPATIQAKHGSRRGHSRTQQIHYRDYQDRDVCLDAWFPGETLSGLRPYPGCSRQSLAIFRGKKGIQAKNGSVDGRVRGVKAPFFRTARLTWQHSAGKQPVKGGGVCRVIGPSPGEADTVIRMLLARKAEFSRISLRAYRKIPLSCPSLCRISVISAPDNWCIGRVAISCTQSDVCVRLKQTHHHPKGDTP